MTITETLIKEFREKFTDEDNHRVFKMNTLITPVELEIFMIDAFERVAAEAYVQGLKAGATTLLDPQEKKQ